MNIPRLVAAFLLTLPLLAAPALQAAGCCSDEACCKAGCTHCKH
jgi:hypothetical protein